MSRIATIFILIMIFGFLVGNDVVQGVLKTIWLVIWAVFFLGLLVYHWFDHRGTFSHKKKNKEG